MSDIVDGWARATAAMGEAMTKAMASSDPFAISRSMVDFGADLGSGALFEMQMDAARQWGAFWTTMLTPRPDPAAACDHRFGGPKWESDPWFRAVRDSYLLASAQLKRLAVSGNGEANGKAVLGVLLDEWLKALSSAEFAAHNPAVVERTIAAGGSNLAQGFAMLVDDIASGKGAAGHRTRPAKFVKGETIATTPGEVVFQNDLFQLIQYTPYTTDVAAEPMLYVPPLANRFYLIDLQPTSSLVKWLVDGGRTVFAVSWVNPDDLQNSAIEDYVRTGIVEAIGVVRKRAGGEKIDLFATGLGSALVAVTLAYLAAKGGADVINSATLIGSGIDVAGTRDSVPFSVEAECDPADATTEGHSIELQQLISAMRADGKIWSSVVDHYLLDRPAPPDAVLYWFEDRARMPAAFAKAFGHEMSNDSSWVMPVGLTVRGTPIDLAVIDTPMMSIAFDGRESTWQADHGGAKLLNATFVLAGPGHGSGVISPPWASDLHYWTNEAPFDTAANRSESAARHDGSWWPMWTDWLTARGSGKRVPARYIADGIESAPGSYVLAA